MVLLAGICRAARCSDRPLQAITHVVVHVIKNRAVLKRYLLQAAAVVVGVLEGFCNRGGDGEQERYEENRKRYFFSEVIPSYLFIGYAVQ